MPKNYFRIFDWMFDLGLEMEELIVFAFLSENDNNEFSQYDISQRTRISMHDVLLAAGWLNSLGYCHMELHKEKNGESNYYFRMTLEDFTKARRDAAGIYDE